MKQILNILAIAILLVLLVIVIATPTHGQSNKVSEFDTTLAPTGAMYLSHLEGDIKKNESFSQGLFFNKGFEYTIVKIAYYKSTITKSEEVISTEIITLIPKASGMTKVTLENQGKKKIHYLISIYVKLQ